VFGERCADELKLESPTLVDDPLPLYRAIGQRARQLPASSRAPDTIRSEAERLAFDRIGRRPVRRLIFRWVLANARTAVRDRENLRFERTRVFGRVRRVFVEIGRRLYDAGVLADRRDVFYLQVDEVLGFIEGRAATGDLKSLVSLRRAEFTQFAAAPAPPARFESRGPVYLAEPMLESKGPTAADAGAERRGVGCCPGIRRGPVRVVRDPAAVALEPGTIVVAERTDPGWILVFPSAAGLIVERGSLLSHSAIVARELGMPAIVSVVGVTAWLKDGDWVEMDGRTGLVRKVAA
jgi:pyruvate,water dikinase